MDRAVARARDDIETELVADVTGIIIGRSDLPVIHEGDALFHVAETPRAEAATDGISAQLDAAPLYDEDEII